MAIIKGTITDKQKDIGIYGRLVRKTTDSEDNSQGIVNINQVEGVSIHTEEPPADKGNIGDIWIVVEP